MSSPKVLIKRLPHSEGLPLPAYKTAGAAGADIVAAVVHPETLEQFDRRAIPAGFCMAIEPGWEAQIRPRSGLALKHGLSMPNAPGTIDSDYRGELKVLLINLGKEPFTIRRGDRIAQMVLKRAPQAEFVEVDDLDATERGEGGFGSTGVNDEGQQG